ncbi:MAG: prepilin-type N-terminal cleavage/methylation domain-containing protein [Gemmatimonadetes bacterium]|nr:prepilin-type N-terminal cleavage/methylation domain-containing protein [Gemmatimonadota bacterium]
MRANVSRQGFALIEALVALTIVAVAGLGFVDLTAQAARSASRTREVEEQLAQEDRLLTAYALLDRQDLEQRIGRVIVGEYALTVERLDWSLYRVGVGIGWSAPDLVTVIYRPGPSDDQ